VRFRRRQLHGSPRRRWHRRRVGLRQERHRDGDPRPGPAPAGRADRRVRFCSPARICCRGAPRRCRALRGDAFAMVSRSPDLAQPGLTRSASRSSSDPAPRSGRPGGGPRRAVERGSERRHPGPPPPAQRIDDYPHKCRMECPAAMIAMALACRPQCLSPTSRDAPKSHPGADPRTLRDLRAIRHGRDSDHPRFGVVAERVRRSAGDVRGNSVERA